MHLLKEKTTNKKPYRRWRDVCPADSDYGDASPPGDGDGFPRAERKPLVCRLGSATIPDSSCGSTRIVGRALRLDLDMDEAHYEHPWSTAGSDDDQAHLLVSWPRSDEDLTQLSSFRSGVCTPAIHHKK